jgi:Domain of unknown function (DUF3821)
MYTSGSQSRPRENTLTAGHHPARESRTLPRRGLILIAILGLFFLAGIPAVSADYYRVAPIIQPGGQVFIGEQGLDINIAFSLAGKSHTTSNTAIGWWASASKIDSTSATKIVSVADAKEHDFAISPADFAGYTGPWYLVNKETGRAIEPTIQVFTVRDPTLDIKVVSDGSDVSGKSVGRGKDLRFRIDTNQYAALISFYRAPVHRDFRDGYVDINIRTESGTKFTGMYGTDDRTHSLNRLDVSTASWTWGETSTPAAPYSWDTNAINPSTGQYEYPTGTYTIWAESLLNNMKENYQMNGADYTGKTVSRICTITLE